MDDDIRPDVSPELAAARAISRGRSKTLRFVAPVGKAVLAGPTSVDVCGIVCKSRPDQ
jgi:hypothetical protein